MKSKKMKYFKMSNNFDPNQSASKSHLMLTNTASCFLNNNFDLWIPNLKVN